MSKLIIGFLLGGLLTGLFVLEVCRHIYNAKMEEIQTIADDLLKEIRAPKGDSK